MLETIREYAGEKLVSGEPEGATERHLDYYLARAREFGEESATGTYELDRIDVERDNLRVAFDTALVLRPGEAVELAGCLSGYWLDRGLFHEGRVRTAAALSAPVEIPARMRARALRVSASLAAKQADLDEAERLGREALEICRAIHDVAGVGRVLNTLGVVAWYRGDLRRATVLFEDALSEYDSIHEENEEDVSRTAHARRIATSNLAAVATAAGDHARAIKAGREIAAGVRGQDDFALVIALNGLGLALEATEQADEARRCFEEAISVSRARGFTEPLAYVLASLAHLEVARAPSDAVAHYQESLELMGEMGEVRGVAYCLEGLSGIALSRGVGVVAATLLGAASKMRERTGIPLDPGELSEVKRRVDEAARALGSGSFDAAWSRGTALSVDEAVELGLGLMSSP